MSNARNTCPICDRVVAARHTPFCSQGCRDRDLLQWLGDGYRLPGPPLDEMESGQMDGGQPEHD